MRTVSIPILPSLSKSTIVVLARIPEPGATCTLSVVFRPTTNGERTAKLNIELASQKLVIFLSGIGK
jgi:hypothetical protein